MAALTAVLVRTDGSAVKVFPDHGHGFEIEKYVRALRPAQRGAAGDGKRVTGRAHLGRAHAGRAGGQRLAGRQRLACRVVTAAERGPLPAVAVCPGLL